MIFAAIGLVFLVCSIAVALVMIHAKFKVHMKVPETMLLSFAFLICAGFVLCVVDYMGTYRIVMMFSEVPVIRRLLALPWIG